MDRSGGGVCISFSQSYKAHTRGELWCSRVTEYVWTWDQDNGWLLQFFRPLTTHPANATEKLRGSAQAARPVLPQNSSESLPQPVSATGSE